MGITDDDSVFTTIAAFKNPRLGRVFRNGHGDFFKDRAVIAGRGLQHAIEVDNKKISPGTHINLSNSFH